MAQQISFQPLPVAVQQQAEIYQMASLTADYHPRFTNPFAIIGLAVLAIIVDIALLVAMYSAGFIVYILVVVPILAVIWAIRGLLFSNLHVYTFTNGIIRAKGRAVDVIRYDQVAQVFFISRKGRYGSVSYTLTVVLNNGASFKFTNVMKYISTLGSTVQSEVVKRHIPLAMEAFKGGSVLRFGPFNVSLQGIGTGSAILPWNMMQPVILYRGNVVIKQIGQRSDFAKAKVAQVPNLSVFLTIAKYAQGSH